MIDPVHAISAIAPQLTNNAQAIGGQNASVSFEQLLRGGIEAADGKIAEANRMVTAFTLDNDIPTHQVTFALEQARLSLEMMIQVRNRLVEGYQQIMNMQV